MQNIEHQLDGGEKLNFILATFITVRVSTFCGTRYTRQLVKMALYIYRLDITTVRPVTAAFSAFWPRPLEAFETSHAIVVHVRNGILKRIKCSGWFVPSSGIVFTTV